MGIWQLCNSRCYNYQDRTRLGMDCTPYTFKRTGPDQGGTVPRTLLLGQDQIRTGLYPVHYYQDRTRLRQDCTLGWVKFSEWKKKFVVVAKFVEDPKKICFSLFNLNCFAKLLLQQDICFKSASYPLLPGLVRLNIENNSANSKKRLHF